MIDLYYGPTSNGRKVSIMLAECGLPYRLQPIDILAGDQFKPEFLRLNPNNKMPVIVDHDGPEGRPVTVFESGAILFYLAEKTGRFLPRDGNARYECMQWLMFQMAGIGPMFGQWVHFSMYAPETIPYAVERYRREVDRLRLVLNTHLTGRDYLVDEYSIADMACWPWIRGFRTRLPPEVEMPALEAWIDRIAERPAAVAGYDLLADRIRPEAKGEAPVGADVWNVLYGTVQHGSRFRG